MSAPKALTADPSIPDVWEEVYRWRKATLLDGTTDAGKLMRSKVNGEDVYRRMTEEEALIRMERHAW